LHYPIPESVYPADQLSNHDKDRLPMRLDQLKNKNETSDHLPIHLDQLKIEINDHLPICLDQLKKTEIN
jgi:hypothetical protein